MQTGPFQLIARSSLAIGNNVITKRPIQVAGSPQHIGAQFINFDIPEGVEGQIIANGMYDKQKIVRFELVTKNGKAAFIDCPLMVETLDAKESS